MGMSFISLMLMLRLALSTADLLADVKCEEDPLGYVVPDPTYCDRYLECGPGRGSSIQLCPPGQALDLQTGFCQVEDKVDCSTREMRYQKERAKLTSPVRRFHSRGGSGLLSRGGSSQVTERGLSRGGPSQATERNPPTTAILPPVTEATLEEDQNPPRLNLFGSRRRPSILSSKTTTTVPETVSSTPKSPSRNTEEDQESSKTKLSHRQSSFTRSRTTSEDVASPTAEHFNEVTTDTPQTRGSFIRITSPTKRPIVRTFITNTLTTPRRTSANILLKPLADGTSHLDDLACGGSEEYIVPDPHYCDRYLSCPDRKIVLCLTDMVLDINLGFCQRKADTDCKNRKLIYREAQEEEEQTRRIKEEMSEIIAATNKAKTEDAQESSDTKLPRRLSSFTRSRTIEDVASSTAEDFNDATTNTLHKRGPSVRITPTTRRPLISTKSSSTKLHEVPTPLQAIIAEVFEARTTSTDPLLDVTCDRGTAEYVVPDPTHCDRYLSCPEGQLEICQRGLVIDLDTGYCIRRRLTDCKGRERIFRDVENKVEAKLDEKVRKFEEDSRLKAKLANTRNVAKEVTKPISTTISPAPTSKTVSSHSPDLVPSFEVDGTDTASSRSSFSRSVPNSPSTLQDGLLARNPASSSSSESLFPRITVSKPSSSDFTNPGRPLLKLSSSHSTFPRIQFSKPASSDANNPGRPIVFQPVSTTTTTTTTTPPANVDPLDELTCEVSEAGYIVPDPEQCDRFAECSFQGEKFYKFCPIGLVLSMTKGVCDYPEQVDCSDRPKLQSSLGKGQCPRQNGKFAVATDTSCRQYVDCRGGEGFIKSCGVGQVFDDNLGCVHPDQTARHGCSALDPDEFQCPPSELLSQKFGDHDRLSHPTDCKLFYSCLKNGQKRLLGCQKPAVFNPETGLCDAQENVPGCEGYYVQEVVGVDKDERNKIAQEIREQLIKEFGLDKRF